MTEYSISEKGELILAVDMGQTIRSACKERGLPYETGRNWIRNRDDLGFPKSDVVKLVKEQWEEKIGGIVEVGLKIIDKANKQVINNLSQCSARDAAVIFGIYMDKLGDIKAAAASSSEEVKDISGMSEAEQLAIVERVYNRMKDSRDAVDVAFEVVDSE